MTVEQTFPCFLFCYPCVFLSEGSCGLSFVEEQVAPNKGYAELGKKARKTHEEILEKLCRNDIRISPEFFENVTKIEAK